MNKRLSSVGFQNLIHINTIVPLIYKFLTLNVTNKQNYIGNTLVIPSYG